MEPSQSCAPKTKPKSITNGHKNDEIGSIQKPRGHKEDGASFPNQIQYKVSQFHNKSTLKRRTEGGRRRGGGLKNRRVHELITKAAINLTQVKGYLYPRDRSDRLACSTPCTRSHPTADVLSLKRTLLRDAAILIKIRSAVLEGPRNPGRWPVLRKPPNTSHGKIPASTPWP